MKKSILTSIVFLLTMAAQAYAGSTQLNTYYPSPLGVYDRLQLPPDAALTEPCDAGTVYDETGVGLRFCDETTNTWKALGGGVWTQDSINNYIYPTDTAGNPDLKIGIGTITPIATLDVNHSSTSATAADERGINITANDTGTVDAGTDTTTGLYTSVTRTNPSTGLVSSVGIKSVGDAYNWGGGSSTAYGGIFVGNNAQMLYGLSAAVKGDNTTLYSAGVEITLEAGTLNIPLSYGIDIIADRDSSNKTNYYGIKIGGFSDYGQTIVNNYGLYVDSREFQSTNKYAIYADGPTDTTYFAGNVGIGTTAPEFKLSLDNDGGIIAKGTYGSGATLTTAGAGTRLIWYPKKAAFRAGVVAGTEWDDVNIGSDSVALGYGNTASGDGSVALGVGSSATGLHAMALGEGLTVSGDYSYAFGLSNTVTSPQQGIALGFENVVSGTNAVAIGANNTVDGDQSIAIGSDARASGTSSTAIGYSAVADASSGGALAIGWTAQATASYATSLGYNTHATGMNSTAIGESNKAEGQYALAFGPWTDAAADSSMAIGKGYDEFHPLPNTTANSIAIGVMGSTTDTTPEVFIKDGAVGIGTTTPTEKLEVNGNVAVSGNLIAGYEIVTGGGGSPTATATCPAGKYIIGGGCNAYLGETLNQSYPPDSQSWFCKALNQVTAYAICIRFQ